MGKAKKAKAAGSGTAAKAASGKAASGKAKRAPAAATAEAASGNGGAEPAPRPKKIKNKRYEDELFRLQVELVKMLEWIKHEGLKVVVIFEGRDAAGKGGVIKRITQHLSPRICRVVALPAPTEREQTQWYFQRYVSHLPAAGEMVLFDRSWYNRAGVERVMGFCTDEEHREFLRTCPEFERMLVRSVIKRITQHLSPRICRVVALPAPTEREQTQWYFQRYVSHLPAAGEMVLFDRSWYNRAGVERVMGFCTDEEHREFLRTCPEFERMLVRSGIKLIKYWFSVSDEEQERRFQSRLEQSHKRWKLSPMDLESRRRWATYSKAKDEMFAHTDIKQAPWYVVDADVKKHARLNCISHLLNMIPYEDLTPEPIELPQRAEAGAYVRPPFSDQTLVPPAYP